MKDNLILIVNEKGKLETAPIGLLKANANYTSTITVITPMPLDNVVMANFNKRNSVDWNVSQFLIPSGNKKGKDILDKTHDLYQKVYDWNVFEGTIESKAVAYFAKYRADLLYVSIGVGSQQTPELAENYKGVFNYNKPLPETAENGDYYISNGYNFNDKNIKWTLNDIAYYWNGWKKSNYIGTFNTTSVAVPVDPNIPTNIEIVADQDLAVLLAGKIATIEEDIVNLDILTQEHQIRISNLENDNEVNKTDIADLKLKDQEQDQRLNNIETDIDNITESIKIDNDTLVRENEVIKVSDKLTNQINVNKNDIANNAAEIQSVKDTTYTKTQSDSKFATIQAMDLQLQEKLNVKPDGTNPLVIGNKLNSTYIDSLYITDVFVVAAKSELTALKAQRGDIAIVENENKTYVLKSGSPTVMSNWVELLFPVSVVSVNGKTGAVILGISDIPELESTLNSKLAINVFENFKGEVEVDYAKKTDLIPYATETYVDNAVSALEVDNFAKLNEANAFTQPQSIPSGTEPQHAINVANLDNFKTNEFRGVNLFPQDVQGTDLGDGWIETLNADGLIVRFHPETATLKVNGVAEITTYHLLNLKTPKLLNGKYITSGTKVGEQNNKFVLYMHSPLEFFCSHTYAYREHDFENYRFERLILGDVEVGREYNDFTIKLKLEKGDKATPYTKPFEIPPYTTLDEVMELLKELELI